MQGRGVTTEPIEKELWLVRHGQTTRNRDGALAGWADVDLTAEGEAQARALRPRLADIVFTQAWSSDLLRAVRTSELAYGPVPSDRRLREIDFGDLDGQSWAQLTGQYKDALLKFEGFAAPNGESLLQLGHRVEEFLVSLPAGRHLLFTHGGVIRLICHRLGHLEFPQPGSLLVVDWGRQRIASAAQD